MEMMGLEEGLGARVCGGKENEIEREGEIDEEDEGKEIEKGI